MSISKLNQDRRRLMYGCEIYALKYEGLVYVKSDNTVWSCYDQTKRDTLNTNAKISRLWKEMLREEGI